MIDYQLGGKVALVTGAARGIGLGIAQRLAGEGCRVVMNDIAATVLFLASSEAGYITGQTLYVDGGLTCQLYSPDFEIPFMIDPPPHPYPDV